MRNVGVYVTLICAIAFFGISCDEGAQAPLGVNEDQNANKTNNTGQESDSNQNLVNNDTSSQVDTEGTDSTNNETENLGSGDTVTATIRVPADFDCTPNKLNTFFFTSASVADILDAGGIAESIPTPNLMSGQDFVFETSQTGLEGTYYLAVAVYCEGGGEMIPVAGVDWIGIATTPTTLGAGTGQVDAGVIEIELLNLSNVGTTEGDTEPASGDTVKATIVVPAEFDCVPTNLTVVFYDTPNLFSIPAAIASRTADPAIVAGQNLEVEIDQAGLEGDYYLTAIVYCEGGNGAFPITGVDWAGTTSSTITVGAGTGLIDIGEIPISLIE